MYPMSLVTTFPQELIDRVIDEAAYSDSDATLRCCALVCRAFLPPSQRHIFSFVDCIVTEFTQYTCFERLYEALCQSPHLIRYIKSLAITCRCPDDLEIDEFLAPLDTTLVPVISLLRDLRALVILDTPWGSLPTRSKLAICDLCAKSNVSQLHLGGIKDISFAEFSQLVASPSLRDLYFSGIDILPQTDDTIEACSQSQLTRLSLYQSSSTDTIVAWLGRGNCLSNLRRLSGLWDANSTPHLQSVIDTSNTSLNGLFLITYFGLPTDPYPHLSFASIKSLRAITLYFSFDITEDTGRFFPWLTELLDSHGSPSPLTMISLGFCIHSATIPSTSSGPKNWDILARTLSRECFPSLETFSMLLHGDGVTCLPELSDRFVATAKQALPDLDDRGILKFRSGDRIPLDFFT